MRQDGNAVGSKMWGAGARAQLSCPELETSLTCGRCKCSSKNRQNIPTRAPHPQGVPGFLYHSHAHISPPSFFRLEEISSTSAESENRAVAEACISRCVGCGCYCLAAAVQCAVLKNIAVLLTLYCSAAVKTFPERLRSHENNVRSSRI